MKRVTFVLATAIVTAVVLSGCQAQQPVTSESSESASSTPVQTDESAAQESAQAWADETFGTFEAFTVTGSGAEEIVFPDDAKSGFYAISWAPGHWVKEDSYAQVYGEDGTFHEAGTADYHGDSASVAYGLDPAAGPAGWIGVAAGAGDWSITVSPISALPALPETGGYDAYLYAGTEQPVVFSSTNAGRVNVHQFNGVDATDSILSQEDFTAVGTLLAGPSVINVQLDSVSPWTRSTN
jgi:outer membrane murein-binding lipoprotein Lpp